MRKVNSIKNFITSTVPFIILIFIGFWKVNVWQNTMDEDVYALNQLFFQIFAYLSLAEAGIGSLVQKEYYKLFADEDKDTICIYYTLSKKMLRNVCYIIIVIGVILSFFLQGFANNNALTLQYMQKIFILFLAKSLVEYFMFSPRFVIQADQKIYKINLQMNLYKILEGVMETLLIMYGISYEKVLIATFLLRIVMNLHLNRIVFKEYPWLKEVKDTKGIKIRGMQHVLLYKVVTVIYENVDILLISAFVNPISVIIYSNYKYITKYLNDLIYMVGSALTSSLGNLLYSESNERSFQTYEMINTLFYFLASVLTTALGFCINSFICIWVGDNKLFTIIPFICIMFLFYHYVVRRPQYILKDVFALYKELQFVSIAESVLNLGLSFLLVKEYGITGVLVATVVSTLLTNFWYFPMYLYRKVFNKKAWHDILKYLVVTVWTIVLLILSYCFLPTIPSDGYISWFLWSCIYTVAVLAVSFIFFYAVFQSFRKLVVQCVEMFLSLVKRGDSCEKSS